MGSFSQNNLIQQTKIFSVIIFCALIIEIRSTPVSSSSKCAGVACIPNPGNCRASYGGGDGCCPVWQCTSKSGGSFTSYGMTRSSDGYGGRVSQSAASSSFSSNNGGGGTISSRVGSGSNYGSSNSGFQSFPNPPNIFALFSSVFPGFFNFYNNNNNFNRF